MKHIARSRFSIVNVASPIEISVADKWFYSTTILDTILISTLNIVRNSLCSLLVSFSRIMHELGNHTNNKGEIWSFVCQINQDTKQLWIKSGVDSWRVTVF